MAYLTATEVTNLKVKLAKQSYMDSLSDEKLLKFLIRDDEASKAKQRMKEGVDYYENENKILMRKIKYFLDGQEVEDTQATNSRLSHNFHRLITEQKVGYIAGNPISISAKEESDEPLQEAFMDLVKPKKFYDVIPQWIKGSTNKGVEYIYPFINERGEFDYTIFDAREIIPVYDSRFQNTIEEFIRYYYVDDIDEKGNAKRIKKAEWYRKENVSFYIETKNSRGESIFIKDEREAALGGNPRSYFFKYNTQQPETKIGMNWDRVPIVVLPNNDEWIGDLKFYKQILDDYDLLRSDLSNSLIDLQNAIWILKNYEGTSLKEFMRNLKKFKAIKVGEDGGAESRTVDIPVEAHKFHVDKNEDNIFVQGMAVDMNQDKFGNSPSGIALKFMYALLDLKANISIRKLIRALSDFTYFAIFYLQKVAKQKPQGIEQANEDSLEFTINKNIPINESEKITNLKNSVGQISKATIVANHPYVDDPEAELEQLDAEREESMSAFQEFQTNDEDEE